MSLNEVAQSNKSFEDGQFTKAVNRRLKQCYAP